MNTLDDTTKNAITNMLGGGSADNKGIKEDAVQSKSVHGLDPGTISAVTNILREGNKGEQADTVKVEALKPSGEEHSMNLVREKGRRKATTFQDVLDDERYRVTMDELRAALENSDSSLKDVEEYTDKDIYGGKMDPEDSPTTEDFLHVPKDQVFLLKTDMGMFIIDRDGYDYARYIAVFETPTSESKEIDEGAVHNWLMGKINGALIALGVPEERHSEIEDAVFSAVMSGTLGDGKPSEVTSQAIADLITQIAGEEASPTPEPASADEPGAEEVGADVGLDEPTVVKPEEPEDEDPMSDDDFEKALADLEGDIDDKDLETEALPLLGLALGVAGAAVGGAAVKGAFALGKKIDQSQKDKIAAAKAKMKQKTATQKIGGQVTAKTPEDPGMYDSFKPGEVVLVEMNGEVKEATIIDINQRMAEIETEGHILTTVPVVSLTRLTITDDIAERVLSGDVDIESILDEVSKQDIMNRFK